MSNKTIQERMNSATFVYIRNTLTQSWFDSKEVICKLQNNLLGTALYYTRLGNYVSYTTKDSSGYPSYRYVQLESEADVVNFIIDNRLYKSEDYVKLPYKLCCEVTKKLDSLEI